MLERYTVESIAGVILSDLKDGRVQPRMLRRFRRQGKRDGRRNRSHEPTRDLIVYAVGVATSKICEKYMGHRENIRVALAGLESEAKQTEEILQRTQATPTPSAAENAPATARALAEMQSSRRAQRLQALVGHVADLRKQAETQADTLSSLPSRYRQLTTTCEESGSLLWAAYRLGFEKGRRRRVSPEDVVPGPAENLEFDVPCTFALAVSAPGGQS